MRRVGVNVFCSPNTDNPGTGISPAWVCGCAWVCVCVRVCSKTNILNCQCSRHTVEPPIRDPQL